MNQQQTDAPEGILPNISHDSRVSAEGWSDVSSVCTTLRIHIPPELVALEPSHNSANRKRGIAEKHGLQIVRGKIPLADLRIGYETPDREMARLDLELATEHYRSHNLTEKVRAGFSICARLQKAIGLHRSLDRRELTAENLSP